jgi:hypothetical protein
MHVQIPAPIAKKFGDQCNELEFDCDNLAKFIPLLQKKHPAVANLLLKENKPACFLHFYLNNHSVQHALTRGDSLPLEPDAVMSIQSSIPGG